MVGSARSASSMAIKWATTSTARLRERALAGHSARSASLARPALTMRRCRWGGQRGHSPSPARGPAKRGPSGYAGSPALAVSDKPVADVSETRR